MQGPAHWSLDFGEDPVRLPVTAMPASYKVMLRTPTNSIRKGSHGFSSKGAASFKWIISAFVLPEVGQRENVQRKIN